MNKLLLSSISLIALTASFTDAYATSCKSCGAPTPAPAPAPAPVPTPGSVAALQTDYTTLVASGIKAGLLASNFTSTVTTHFTTASLPGLGSYMQASGSTKGQISVGAGITTATEANAVIAHEIGMAESQTLENAAVTATNKYGANSAQAIAAVNAAEKNADAIAAKLVGAQNYINGLSVEAANETAAAVKSGGSRTDADTLFARVQALAQANPGLKLTVPANLVPTDTGTAALSLQYNANGSVNTANTSSLVASEIPKVNTALATETKAGDTTDAEQNQGADMSGVGADAPITSLQQVQNAYNQLLAAGIAAGILPADYDNYIDYLTNDPHYDSDGPFFDPETFGSPQGYIFIPTDGSKNITEGDLDGILAHEMIHGLQAQDGQSAIQDAIILFDGSDSPGGIKATDSLEAGADLGAVDLLAAMPDPANPGGTLGIQAGAQDFVDALGGYFESADENASENDATHNGTYLDRIDLLSQNLAQQSDQAGTGDMAPELLLPADSFPSTLDNDGSTPMIIESIVVDGKVENDIQAEQPQMSALIESDASAEATGIADGNTAYELDNGGQDMAGIGANAMDAPPR